MKSIILKNGIAIIPDTYELLAEKCEFLQAEGILIVECTNSTDDTTLGVYPLARYGENTDVENLLAIHAYLLRHPDVIAKMKGTLSPKEIMSQRKPGEIVADTSFWPMTYPLYRENDPVLDAYLKTSDASSDTRIIPMKR